MDSGDAVQARVVVSFDEGKTWRPMPQNFKQVGRILESSPTVVVQTLGRGRVVWYAIAGAEPPARG